MAKDDLEWGVVAAHQEEKHRVYHTEMEMEIEMDRPHSEET